MKKFISGVVVGFVASCGVGFAASSLDHNGVFWNKLNGAAKTGYINGYGDAMQVSIGKLDSLSIAGDLFHWRGSDKIISQLARELSTEELTPDQAVKTARFAVRQSQVQRVGPGPGAAAADCADRGRRALEREHEFDPARRSRSFIGSSDSSSGEIGRRRWRRSSWQSDQTVWQFEGRRPHCSVWGWATRARGAVDTFGIRAYLRSGASAFAP